MPEPDGTIVSRNQVVLFGHFANTFERLYDESILSQVSVERMFYLSDGLKVAGYIAMPKEAGKYPVLIWNRGGYGERGALDDLTAWLILASTATWGYVVLATQYRGNRGGDGEEDWGGLDVNDSLNLLNVAENIPECDMSRIGIEGASRGGMTTYRALVREQRFKCAIIHAGLADIEAIRNFSEHFEKFTDEKLAGLTGEQKQQRLCGMSAVCFAEKLPRDIPFLLMHGTHDVTVPISQTEAIVERMNEYGIPHRYEVIDGGGHVALKDGSYKQIDDLRKAWLAEHLG